VNIVSMNKVSKSYSKSAVLENISLEIDKGARVVILGPSGCGKTTILRLIAGFIAPDIGSIFVNGSLVAKDGQIIISPERRNLGMVFQDLALWPHLSVSGNLEFGLKAKGIQKSERRVKIKKMLNMVGMVDYADRKPDSLSGGQQQRVALARTLVLEPGVILMDEPLSSLDSDLNKRLRKEIIILQEKLGFTMIYVTHNQDETSEMATKVISMT